MESDLVISRHVNVKFERMNESVGPMSNIQKSKCLEMSGIPGSVSDEEHHYFDIKLFRSKCLKNYFWKERLHRSGLQMEQ